MDIFKKEQVIYTTHYFFLLKIIYLFLKFNQEYRNMNPKMEVPVLIIDKNYLMQSVKCVFLNKFSN